MLHQQEISLVGKLKTVNISYFILTCVYFIHIKHKTNCMLCLLQVKNPTIKKEDIGTTKQFRSARFLFMWTEDQNI